MKRGVLLHAAVLAVLGGVTLVYTWPLAAHVRSTYAARAPGAIGLRTDQLFCSWVLASDVRRLVHDPLHVFETNNLHPFRHTLAFSENMLGLALPVLPVQLVWDDPTLTHNVAALLSILLTAWGVFLLVRELGGDPLAALVAGILAIYSPPLWGEILILPLVAGHWTPIALFLLVRLVRTRDWRLSIGLGLAIALQVWSSLQHGFFLLLALAVTVPVLTLLGRSAWRSLPHTVAAGVLAGLLSVPIVLPYGAVRWELDTESRPSSMEFSLKPSRVAPPVSHPLAYLAERLRSGERLQAVGTLTPWVLIAAGAAAVVLARRRPTVDLAALVALAAGGLVNFLFALGPLGDPRLPTLYPLLAGIVPGLAWVRVPMRAVLYSSLVLTISAGVGLAAVLVHAHSRLARLAIAGAALALTVVEAGWRPVPLAPAPARTSAAITALGALDERCAIADLPANFESNGIALFRSTVHWHPLVNGYSGFSPLSAFAVFPLLNSFPARDALAFLDEAGTCAVLVRATPGSDYLSRVVADSEALGLAVERYDSEALIRLPPPPRHPDPPLLPRDGWSVTPRASAVALDGDLETVWRGEIYGEPERLTVDLGNVATVSGIALDLGRHLRLYLRSYRIEGSLDGTTWTTLAENLIAVPPLASYRADYLHVRQRIDFPPASIRWLRIGPYRRPRGAVAPDAGFDSWGVAELLAYAG